MCGLIWRQTYGTTMTKVCYLCGKGISVEDVVSDDHVVPKQFIKRSQPKTKGFDYAGK